MSEMICKKCGEPVRRLMILALLEDFGAYVSPSANRCRSGGKHDFIERPKQIDAKQRGVTR